MAIEHVSWEYVYKVLEWLFRRFRSWSEGRRFRRIFGDSVSRQSLTLVYAELQLAEPVVGYPFAKPGGNDQFRFSISRPVSSCEVRAANYIASAVGGALGSVPDIRSDVECRAKLDLDFVSFGGPQSNFKSLDVQSNPGNKLVQFDQAKNSYSRIGNGSAHWDPSDRTYNYGL